MHVGVQVCGWWVAGVGAVVPGVVVVVVGHYLVAEGEVMRRQRRWLGAHQNTARSRIHLPRSGRSNKIACPSDSVFVFVWVSAALSTTETSRPLRASTASEPFRCFGARRAALRCPRRPPAHSPPTAAIEAPPALDARNRTRRAAGCCAAFTSSTKSKGSPFWSPNRTWESDNSSCWTRAGRPAAASQQWIVFAWCCRDYTLESWDGSFAIICIVYQFAVATHYYCFVFAENTNTCFC